MKGVKIPHLIAIAALCWLVLISIQAKWIMDSRNLIEEQFDQKVSLALAAAIESLDSTTQVACSSGGYLFEEAICEPAPSGAFARVTDKNDQDELYSAVGEALAFYDIDVDYRVTIGASTAPSCDVASPYCCAINPFESSDPAVVSIEFPGKNAYLFKKIWWMLATSIFILLFILGVFTLAVRALIHQKRISEWNVDFFNNMAHEFKTPLTNISLAMQRLVKRNPSLRDDPFVDVVRREDAKLGSQIDRVLSIAALDHGGPYLKRQKLDLGELLRSMIEDMQLSIQESNANVTLHLPNEEIWIMGDRFHLLHAFKNLVDNALKYTDDTPVIDIRLQRNGSSITLSFEDNGIGISPQNREMIFKKFHRIPSGNRHDRKGFGLGLSYVKTIIEDHKGTIRALKRQQQGSQFELTLPTA